MPCVPLGFQEAMDLVLIRLIGAYHGQEIVEEEVPCPIVVRLEPTGIESVALGQGSRDLMKLDLLWCEERRR